MAEVAELSLNGTKYELPVITGSEGEKAIDITSLRGKTGYITIDSGFKNTGSTKSEITFLDGEKGILRYCGYPIEQLAEQSSFIEVCYLLLNGDLPSKVQLKEFEDEITHHTLIHEDLMKFFDAYPSNAHPMGLLTAMVSSLSSFYPASLEPGRPKHLVNLSIIRLIAKLPTIISMIHRKTIGHAINYPINKLNYTENFINMMFATKAEDYKISPIIVDALNKLLILHADHEQNCSTSTVRIVGSSQANIYASMSAGISALWGPLHGGANQAVIEMLEKIKNDGGNIDKWVEKAKDKNDSFRLMGFGHRVYKNFDPRANIIKVACDNVLNDLGITDPVLDIAKKLEEVALKDPYFVERKLYPNVDFYSGIIYRAIGIPTEMFTVMFALGRLPGWISQWKEMMKNGEPIGRPRQIYTGHNERNYEPMDKRK